jgi:hypothetical protein
MSDDDKLELRPATTQEIEESLSFALRYAGRRRVHHADDVIGQDHRRAAGAAPGAVRLRAHAPA